MHEPACRPILMMSASLPSVALNSCTLSWTSRAARTACAAIAHADLALRRGGTGRDRAAVDDDGGKSLACPVVDVDLTAGLDRAQAIGTGRQGGADGSLLPRRQDLLHDDMRRRVRSI